MHPATLLEASRRPLERGALHFPLLRPLESSSWFATFHQQPPLPLGGGGRLLPARGVEGRNETLNIGDCCRKTLLCLRGERFERKKEPDSSSSSSVWPLCFSLACHQNRSPSLSSSLGPRRLALPLARENRGMLTRCSAPTFMEMHPLIYPASLACSRLCLTSVLAEVYYPARPLSPPLSLPPFRRRFVSFSFFVAFASPALSATPSWPTLPTTPLPPWSRSVLSLEGITRT